MTENKRFKTQEQRCKYNEYLRLRTEMKQILHLYDRLNPIDKEPKVRSESAIKLYNWRQNNLEKFKEYKNNDKYREQNKQAQARFQEKKRLRLLYDRLNKE